MRFDDLLKNGQIVKENTTKFVKESSFVFVKLRFGTKNFKIGLNN